jgi:predicted KAP-like P-loop ATPase
MSAAPDRNLQDRPISSAEEDRLDRGAFVENLLRALIERQMDEDGQTVSCRATGFVVGLTGPWGLGKSSVLHLVRERLEREDKVIVAYFNPWLFKGRDELILGFFGALRSAMGRDRAGRFKALVEPLKRYQGAILFPTRVAALFADLHGAGGAGHRHRQQSQ